MSEASAALGANASHAAGEGTELLPRIVGRLRDEVEARPLGALLASLCVGFALGGGVNRGVVTLVLGAGARAVGVWLEDAILERSQSFDGDETETRKEAT